MSMSSSICEWVADFVGLLIGRVMAEAWVSGQWVGGLVDEWMGWWLALRRLTRLLNFNATLPNPAPSQPNQPRP